MGLHRGRNSNGYVDDENPYWISFSDIMAGLLVIFILASLVLILELMVTRQLVQDNIDGLKEAVEARNRIMTEIKGELAEKGILVELSDNKEVLHIPEEALTFVSNKSQIQDQYQSNVYEIGKVLYERITFANRNTKYLDTIFVEGHTDAQRSYKQGGNWRLSTDRAISIWRYWMENLPENMLLEDLDNHNAQKLFSVSGYSKTRRLVEDELTASDREKNRRIDIRITVKEPTITVLQKVIDPASGI